MPAPSDTTSSSPNRDNQYHEGNAPPPKRRKKSQTGDAQRAREVGLMRDGLGSSASFVGSASGIYFIRSVYGAIGSSSADKTSPAQDLVPGEDDRLATGTDDALPKSIWHNNEVSSEGATSSSSDSITFEQLTEWTGSYFDAWHPAFPFLHAPTILNVFETISREGVARVPEFDLTIIRAMISISLADRRQSQRPPYSLVPHKLVFTTFDAALESVQRALTRPATIGSLQAVVCVQLFLVSMLRLNAASRLGGLVVRMAFQLGLHRCPSRYSTFSENEQQLRKRIFWTIYCIERHLCQALGLPLTIRDDDVDVCYLNKEKHDIKPQNPPTEAPEKISSGQYDDRLQLLSFLAIHAQIRGLIMELRNKRVEKRDRNADTAVLINAKLTQWWNEVEDFLDSDESDSSSSISKTHKAVLETLKNESVIALNRPLLAMSKDTASYAGAIQSCIGAAKSVLSTLNSLSSSPEVSMTWPSFTWAAWMSAFIILYGVAEGVVSPQVASRYTSRSLKVLDRLAARGSVWPNACAVAIEELRVTLNKRQGNADVVIDRSEQNTAPTPTTGASADRTTSQSLTATAVDPPSTFNSYQHLQAATSNFVVDDLWQDMDFVPRDLPQFSLSGNDPFQGFDIPFWMGQDNYLAYMGSGS